MIRRLFLLAIVLSVFSLRGGASEAQSRTADGGPPDAAQLSAEDADVARQLSFLEDVELVRNLELFEDSQASDAGTPDAGIPPPQPQR